MNPEAKEEVKFEITHKPMIREIKTQIHLDQVKNLYIGKGKCCRCGCGGDYFYPADDAPLIQDMIKKMASGKYEVESIDDKIFEIILNPKGRQEVATLYLKS